MACLTRSYSASTIKSFKLVNATLIILWIRILNENKQFSMVLVCKICVVLASSNKVRFFKIHFIVDILLLQLYFTRNVVCCFYLDNFSR